MKKALTLAAAVLLPILCFGQSWIARYNGTGNSTDKAAALAVDGAGNVYVAGTSTGTGTYTDYATVKYNAAGVEQWARRYNGPANLYDEGKAIAFDGTSIYVTGGSMDTDLYTDIVTIKYNAAGDTQWVRCYNGAADYDDLAYVVGVDRSGNVYAAGYVSGTTTGWDYCLVKYNSAGVQQWVRTFMTNDQDYIVGLAIDGSGNVYVTGSSGDPYFMTWDYLTIKYSPAGDTLWLRRYNGPADGHDEARGIALDSSGNVYVTGGSAAAGSSWDYTTIKYSSSGVEQWVRRYNGPGNLADWGNAIATDPSGNVYVTGGSANSGTDWDYATVKYNSAGTEQWARRFNGTAGGYDEALALSVDASGNACVTGKSDAANLYPDYLTVLYNAAGDSVWTRRYNGPGNNADNAYAVAFDGAGYVYVTGESMGAASDFDYATIKYPGVSVQEESNQGLTTGPRNLSVSPNPFTNRVDIRCTMADARYRKHKVSLRIYDATGRLVKSFTLATRYSLLSTSIVWDGRDDLDRHLPPGVYFVELSAGQYRATRKLVRDAK